MTQYLKIIAAALTLSVLGGLSSASADPDFDMDAPTFFKKLGEERGS